MEESDRRIKTLETEVKLLQTAIDQSNKALAEAADIIVDNRRKRDELLKIIAKDNDALKGTIQLTIDKVKLQQEVESYQRQQKEWYGKLEAMETEHSLTLLALREHREVLRLVRYACIDGGAIDFVKNIDQASAKANEVWEKFPDLNNIRLGESAMLSLLAAMSKEARVEFFSGARALYCEGCGDEQPEGRGRCQCNNDE